MKKRTLISLLLSLCVLFCLAPQAVWAKGSAGISITIGGMDLSPKNIASQLALGGARSAGGTAVGNILSVFGYKTPDVQFREKAEQSLSDIKKTLTEGINKLSSQIGQIGARVTELQDYLATMQKELFKKIDHTEFDTRMTVVNQYTAKVDAIFAEYDRLVKESDYDVAKKSAGDVIAKIKGADLETAIAFLSKEFISTAAGSKTPLVTLYLNYLKDFYPFLHQYYPPFCDYAQYCELELTRTVLLYIEYCNYMQTANAEDAAAGTLWYQRAADAFNTLLHTVNVIDEQIPDSEYILTEDNERFHLVNEEFGISIWFEPGTLREQSFMYVKESEDIGPDYECYYENGDVAPETYDQLRKLKEKYSPDSSMLQFINNTTGANVSSPVWGCRRDEPDGLDARGYYHESDCCKGLQVYQLDPSENGGEGVWSSAKDLCVYATNGDFPKYPKPETEHKEVLDPAIPATCTTFGFTAGSHCSVCNQILQTRKVIPAGHKWDKGKVTKTASTTAAGVKTFTCTVCGAKKTVTIPKLEKKANPLKIKVSKKTYKQSKLKKAVFFKIGASKGQGPVTFTPDKKSIKAKIKVSKKGTVRIPKKCKPGIYKISVKAAGNKNYKAGKKTVTIKVKK